jgi:CHASE2 domain-containing sensor protein
MGMLALLPINTHILDPIQMGLQDFDFTDMTYARLGKNKKSTTDNRIVIVNIEQADRAAIARLLQRVKSYQPKVIGLDVLFETAKLPQTDSALAAEIKQTPNLILASKLQMDNGEFVQLGYFNDKASQTGFANFVSEEGGTIRYFSPAEKVKGKNEMAFAAAVTAIADSKAIDELKERDKEVEIIHYKRQSDKYIVVNGSELLDTTAAFDANILKDKIVLMGLVDENPDNIQDKHFTPMNSKFVGKSTPDMNGVIIHANIISMLLDKDYIAKVPSWLYWLLAVIICWLHMAYFINVFIHNHIWFHLRFKIIQLINAVLIVYLQILFFQGLNIKLDMVAALTAVILSVDILYFYEAFALWANKKYKFKTLFAHHSH